MNPLSAFGSAKIGHNIMWNGPLQQIDN
jgi:hypothetical protein